MLPPAPTARHSRRASANPCSTLPATRRSTQNSPTRAWPIKAFGRRARPSTSSCAGGMLPPAPRARHSRGLAVARPSTIQTTRHSQQGSPVPPSRAAMIRASGRKVPPSTSSCAKAMLPRAPAVRRFWGTSIASGSALRSTIPATRRSADSSPALQVPMPAYSRRRGLPSASSRARVMLLRTSPVRRLAVSAPPASVTPVTRRSYRSSAAPALTIVRSGRRRGRPSTFWRVRAMLRRYRRRNICELVQPCPPQ